MQCGDKTAAANSGLEVAFRPSMCKLAFAMKQRKSYNSIEQRPARLYGMSHEEVHKPE